MQFVSKESVGQNFLSMQDANIVFIDNCLELQHAIEDRFQINHRLLYAWCVQIWIGFLVFIA